MAYTRGTSDNIIVGAAAIFVADAPLAPSALSSVTSDDNSYPSFYANATYRGLYRDG